MVAIRTFKTEIIQASNANLIISVIKTTQRGNELNDAHQRLLISLSEISDSRGTWVISFSTKDEAFEFLEVKQSSFNSNEKPIDYFEETFGAGILALDHDETNSVHSTKHSYLLVRGVESFELKRKKADNLVNIYSQSETTDIQYAILLALKKAHHGTSKLLLSLAWRWNKFDFAQNEIQFPDLMSACDQTKSLKYATNPNEDTYQSRTSSELPLMLRVGNLLNAKLNIMCNPYNGSDYERKAIGVLTECYKKDKKKAHDILIKTLEKPFDKIRPLELAYNYHLKEFMGHDCCQTKLNNIWRGKITVHVRWWKAVMYTVIKDFQFLIKEPEQEPTNDGPKQEPSMKEQKQELDRRKMNFYLKKYPSSKQQLYHVGILCKNQGGIIHFTDAMYNLYTAPFSVYTFNMVSYVIFVLYFSYFIIVDLNETTSLKEYTIWGWALTMLFEETRECFFYPMNKTPGCCGRIRGNDFQYVRFLYSVTVGLYFMRFLQAFLVAENIGPKVIMIWKMVVNLLNFLWIAALFVVSFAVMYHANMYPNSPSDFFWERETVKDTIMHTPFWQIFGEISLDDFIPGRQSGDCDPNAISGDGRKRCPYANRPIIFLAGIFMILSHVVLFNLLIAIFSHTFARVQQKSGHIWKYYWYGIVLEYYNRTVVCPPLIILAHIYRTLRYVVFRCGGFVYDSEF
ncbi:hypothetical protein DPMN_057336, partial [Dreissena polymorpha]